MSSSLMLRGASFRRRCSKSFKKSIALLSLLVFPATWGPWGVLTAEEFSEFSPDQMEQIVEYLTSIENLMREQAVPLADVVAEIGKDSDGILEWVQSNTQWVSYPGMLKGVNGTYASGNGNLLDRSVLLAAMLRTSGYDVRLHKVALNEASQDQLKSYYLGQIPEIELKALPDFDREIADEGELNRIAAEHGISTEALLAQVTMLEDWSRQEWERLMQQLSSQSELIISKLGNPSLDAVSGYQEEDYFYIEFKDAGVGEWDQICPVFGQDIPAHLIEQQSEVYRSTEELPDVLKHEFRLALEVDQFEDGALKTNTVIDQKWAVADLSNEQISIRLTGKGFGRLGSIAGDETMALAEKQAAMVELLTQEEQWICTVVAGGDSTQMGFDNKGDLYDVSEDGYLSLNSKMKSMTSALSMLGSMETKSAVKELVGVRFVFETQVPGKDTIREVRNVFRLDQARLEELKDGATLDESTREERSISCNEVSQLLVQSSKWNLNQYASVELEKFSKSRLALQYYQRLLEAGRGNDFEKKYADIMAKIPATDLLLANYAVMRSNYPKQQDRIYLSEANLVRSTASWKIDGDSFRERRSIDIILNATDTLAQDALTARNDRVEMGVFDTIAEKYVVKQMIGSGDIESATSMFEACEDPDAFELIHGDPRNRDSFVSFAKVDSQQGWYRVNETTGETLGMMESADGTIMGQSATEYVIMLVTAVLTFFGCWAGPTGSAGNFGGCLVCGILAGVAAFAAAAYMAGLLGAWKAGVAAETAVAMNAGAGSTATGAGLIAAACGAIMAVGGWAID